MPTWLCVKRTTKKTARQEAERQLKGGKASYSPRNCSVWRAIYETNPLKALELLEDRNACPVEQRDVAWRFYPERSCRRGELEGLIVWASSVALSGDGKTLALGSADNTIRVWDVIADREGATLKGHSSAVYAVALSGDGKTLASGSYDKTVKVWDVGTGLDMRDTFKGHTSGAHFCRVEQRRQDACLGE